jgi:serine/threonine protein kinase
MSQCFVQMGVIYHIVNNDIQPAIPANISKEGKEFLQLCFDRDPRRRANCDRLLLHPFVANVTTPASQPATHADLNNTFSPIREESSGLMQRPSNPTPPSAQASRPSRTTKLALVL